MNCSDIIPSDISGHCICDEYWIQNELLCNHKPTTCTQECKNCGGWRATLHCDSHSKRFPKNDLNCDANVPTENSGYCLCSGGRRTAYSDCGHPVFTCRKVCALLPVKECPSETPDAHSNNINKKCNTEIQIENYVDDSIDIFIVDLLGYEQFLYTIVSRETYNLKGYCSVSIFRYRYHTTQILLKEYVLASDFIHDRFILYPCYSRDFAPIPPYEFKYVFTGGKFEFYWGDIPAISRPLKIGRDNVFTLNLDFVNIYKEHSHYLKATHKVTCPLCHGKGGLQEYIHICPYCHGSGIYQNYHLYPNNSIQSLSSVCSHCHGYGNIYDQYHICPKCKGNRIIDERIIKNHFFPEGSFVVQYAIDEPYSFDENNLYINHNITLYEALHGYIHSIPHPLLFNITLSYPYPTMQDISIRIPGLGIPLQNTEGCKGFEAYKEIYMNTTVNLDSNTIKYIYKGQERLPEEDLTCHEVIPEGLTGVCICETGRIVPFPSNSIGQLKTDELYSCNHPKICGNLYRGDFIVNIHIIPF
ncbi:hypothetical protein WA158_003555 [Blastocystis sp. Blastoise]